MNVVLYQVASIISALVNFYSIVIFVWAILSWFKGSSKIASDIYNVLDKIVAPYVDLFRRFIPPMGGIDFSPLIALVVLQLVARLILGFLY